MHKQFLTLISVLLVSSAFGQINKGSILVGGNIGYFTTKIENTNGASLSDRKFVVFSPSAGTAIKQNLVLGIDLTYYGSEYESPQHNHMDDSKYAGGGVFIRNYKPLPNNFLLFAQGRIGYANIDREHGNLSNPTLRSTEDGWNINLAFMPGITYKFGEKLLLELALNDLLRLEFEKRDITESSFSGGSSQTREEKSFGISSSASQVPLWIGMRFVFSK